MTMLDGGILDLCENLAFTMVGFMGIFNRGHEWYLNELISGEKPFTGILSNFGCLSTFVMQPEAFGRSQQTGVAAFETDRD